LKRALRRSAALVLVGTTGAARSRHVAEEVSVVKQAKKLIVPIVFDGVQLRGGYSVANGELKYDSSASASIAADEALWAKDIVGLPVSIDGVAALSGGTPAPQVLSRIEKVCDFRRRDTRLRASAAFLAVILVLLVIASVVTGRQAAVNASEAAHQTQI